MRVGDAAAKAAGSGLGLSLAAAVARLHRAQLTLGDNAPGLIVRCEFSGRSALPSSRALLPGATRQTASHRSLETPTGVGRVGTSRRVQHGN